VAEFFKQAGRSHLFRTGRAADGKIGEAGVTIREMTILYKDQVRNW